MSKSEDHLDIIYNTLNQEIEASRNWPIKLLTFITVLFFGISSAHLNDKANELLNNCYLEIVLVLVISIQFVWLIYLFCRYHINYLKCRKSQIKINKQLNSDKDLPKSWTEKIKISLWTRWHGWLFYAFYLMIIYVGTLVIIIKF